MKGRTLRGDRYRLLGPLGHGGQAETYEAIDETTGRRVAVKRFQVRTAKEWKDVELAEREAKTLASLRHPLLPRYVEHFEEDGGLYLVMEKIEGESLGQLRADGRTFSVDEVTRLLVDLADILGYLHERPTPIIHRDIKPANVIRRPDGRFALVDFGSVRDRLKPAGGSTVTGTFGYMAPEQFQGRASPRSDVYGSAATALTMLTGIEPEEQPHQGLAIDVGRALPSRVPPKLVDALGAMLEPNPDERAPSILTKLGPKPTTRRSRDDDDPRESRKARRRRERLARRSRHGPVPPVPRLGAKIGLAVAMIAVWFAVGMIAPVVLILLSVAFGEPLRRAARACVRAAKSSQRALGRASEWIDGRERGASEAPQAREVRVRAVTPEQAQALAIARAEREGEDPDAWVRERAEWEAAMWEAEGADDEGAAGKRKKGRRPSR